MTYLHNEVFEMFCLAKALHDSPFSEKFHETHDQLELDCDSYYELAYDAISLVFAFTYEDFDEDWGSSTWVFGDPCIDTFCRLCQEYETKHGLSEGKNPYRRELEQLIRDGFTFPNSDLGYDYDYDYTWYLSAKDRGRKRLLLFTGEEFYHLTSVPMGLLEIREGFESLNRRLEQELGSEKILRLPNMISVEERKEAA